jgi:hypothetical protein
MTNDSLQGVPNAIQPDNPANPNAPGNRKGDKSDRPGGADTASPLPVPEAVASRFLRVDDRYYFPDRSLAFVDGGDKLKARTHNTEVIRSLLTIAQTRGWDAIQVTGSAQFRQSVWREATQRGIEVKGYDPTPLDRAAMQRTMDRTHSRPQDGPAEHAADTPSTPPRQGSPARPIDSDKPVTGRLLEAGTAHYKFDKTQGQSFFVRLDTEQGERTLWGTALEHALITSKTRVQVGDTVTVERTGSRPVSVQVAKRDANGQVTGHQYVQSHRNTWRIEHPSYFEEQSMKAAAFREEGVPRQEVVRRHPDLTNAVVGQWLAEQFAAKAIDRAGDRQRAVGLAKERIATAVERGDEIAAPKLKPSVAERLDAIERTLDQIERNIEQRQRSAEAARADRSKGDAAHAR